MRDGLLTLATMEDVSLPAAVTEDGSPKITVKEIACRFTHFDDKLPGCDVTLYNRW